LRLITVLGGTWWRIMAVACERLTFGGNNGAMGLSEPAAAAVNAAIATVDDLLDDLLERKCAVMSCATRRLRRVWHPVVPGWVLDWLIPGIGLGILVAVTSAANLKDIQRSIKISSM
jgi:hypothetical protein